MYLIDSNQITTKKYVLEQSPITSCESWNCDPVPVPYRQVTGCNMFIPVQTVIDMRVVAAHCLQYTASSYAVCSHSEGVQQDCVLYWIIGWCYICIY